MAQVVTFLMNSLDGFSSDPEGKIDWHTPNEETHEFINEVHGRYVVHIYDEPTYQIMKFWENPPGLASEPPSVQAYTDLWKAVRKIVVSPGAAKPDPAFYEIWPELTAEALHGVKQNARGEILIAGTPLFKRALALRLLDRIDILTVPVLLGGGEPAFPAAGRTDLKLLTSKTFSNGWLFTSYAVV